MVKFYVYISPIFSCRVTYAQCLIWALNRNKCQMLKLLTILLKGGLQWKNDLGLYCSLVTLVCVIWWYSAWLSWYKNFNTLGFYIMKCQNRNKYTHVCIEMYRVCVLLVPLGNKRARLGSFRVTGSDQDSRQWVTRPKRSRPYVTNECVIYTYETC